MEQTAHLWAIAYDDVARAEQARARITELAAQGHLEILDTAMARHHSDGVVTLDGEPLEVESWLSGSSIMRFLGGLILAVPPLTAGACDRMMQAANLPCPTEVGIDKPFIQEVAALMKRGVTVLFVLDRAGDLNAILQGIHGCGGQVLKSNVDVERTRLVQSTLTATE